jgi:hypothetical protein
MFLKDMWSRAGDLPAIRAPRDIHIDPSLFLPSHPSTVHHYHHHSDNPDNRPQEIKSEDEKDDSDSDTEEKKRKKKRKKPTPVAKYESKSTALWMTLLARTAASFYYSYNWVRGYCMRVCAGAQELVENVG